MRAVFRCDATPEIGFGHLVRCMALAEAFRMYGTQSTFAGHFDEAGRSQLVAGEFEWIDLPAPVNSPDGERAFARLQPPDFLVADSYRVDEAYLEDLKEAGHSVVLLDDFHSLQSYPCRVVLNFTVEAPTYDYPRGPTHLLGPEFFLPRRKLVELRAQSIAKDRSGMARNLFLAIGGSDPKGIAGRLIGILHETHSDCCLRALAPDTPEVTRLINDFASGSQIIARQENLSAEFCWADLVVSGGGLIKYESAYMGVPVAAISQNAGQAGESKAFAGVGLVFDLGFVDDVEDKDLMGGVAIAVNDMCARKLMAERMRSAFPPDPSAHAAKKILEALSR